MRISNGYLITYWEGTQWVAQDDVLSMEDAQDHINVAMEVGMCDLITMHCLDRGDVLYTYELFRMDGKWAQYTSNALMGTYTIGVL